MIQLDPGDRRSFDRRRNTPLVAVMITMAIVIGCGGFVYYWYAFLDTSNYSEVYRQLGISKMPSTLELQPDVRTQLDQLSHEPCYREAIIGLADAMLNAGYPRDANTSLLNFAQRCGASDELLLRRYRALFMASDFSGAAQIAEALVQSDPAGSIWWSIGRPSWDELCCTI